MITINNFIQESIIDPDLIGMKISPGPSLPKRGIPPHLTPL
jgi:hypothetical protein